jgi:hypothetical protein
MGNPNSFPVSYVSINRLARATRFDYIRILKARALVHTIGKRHWPPCSTIAEIAASFTQFGT